MAGWRGLKRGTMAMVVLTAVVGAGPALAAEAPASQAPSPSPLLLAEKALKSGKPELAVRALDAAFAKNLLKGSEIAKAYLLRGEAYAKTGNATAAIADFNSALYLKGLSEEERQVATAAKAAAYQKAGLAPKSEAKAAEAAMPSPAAPPPAIPPKAKASTTAAAAPVAAFGSEQPANAEPLPWQPKLQPASPPTAAVSGPAPAPEPTAAASNENPFNAMLGGFFSFGQNASSAPKSIWPAPTTETTGTTTPAAPGQVTAAITPTPAWKAAAVADAAPATAGPRRVPTHGGIYLQLASLRTTGEADAMVAKLQAEHPAALAGLAPTVTPTVLGNMGTFYTVRLGPFPSKPAGEALCGTLRKEGVDCFFAKP